MITGNIRRNLSAEEMASMFMRRVFELKGKALERGKTRKKWLLDD